MARNGRRPARSSSERTGLREWSQRRDSNPQPPLYESGALPLCYFGLQGQVVVHIALNLEQDSARVVGGKV